MSGVQSSPSPRCFSSTRYKTESVYRRYAIVSEADLREGVAKLAKLHESPPSFRSQAARVSRQRRRFALRARGLSAPEMDESRRSSFLEMEALLTTWLAGANLLEIARVVQVAKAELARRGITLTWSIAQDEDPCSYTKRRPGSTG